MSQKRDLLSDIVSQKRDLLTDCQKCDGHTDGQTDRVTMRGEGLSCYVQLKIIILGRILKEKYNLLKTPCAPTSAAAAVF